MRRDADEAAWRCESEACHAVDIRAPYRVVVDVRFLVDPVGSHLLVQDVDRADEPR